MSMDPEVPAVPEVPLPEPVVPEPQAAVLPAAAPPVTDAQPLSPSDERTWAMLAHLSVLLNLVSGFLGVVAALVIYLVYKERSRYVGFQALQAFLFQLIFWVGAGALTAVAWTISGVLTAVLIGFCLMPIALLVTLVPLGALVYGIVGGVECNKGADFRYWLVGDWAAGMI